MDVFESKRCHIKDYCETTDISGVWCFSWDYLLSLPLPKLHWHNSSIRAGWTMNIHTFTAERGWLDGLEHQAEKPHAPGRCQNSNSLSSKQKGSVNITASLRLQFRLGQAIDWHISQKFNKENWMRRLPYWALMKLTHISGGLEICIHVSGKIREGPRYPHTPDWP